MEEVFKQWREQKSTRLGIALELKCFRLTVANDKVLREEIPALSGNHEEADTKLLLHAQHANSGESTAIIKSQDTDVAILAFNFDKQIPARLLLMRKVKPSVVYLDVSAITEAAGPMLCNALPRLHAFTSCDSVSSFSGKGKKAPLKQCSWTMKMTANQWQCWEDHLMLMILSFLTVKSLSARCMDSTTCLE